MLHTESKVNVVRIGQNLAADWFCPQQTAICICPCLQQSPRSQADTASYMCSDNNKLAPQTQTICERSIFVTEFASSFPSIHICGLRVPRTKGCHVSDCRAVAQKFELECDGKACRSFRARSPCALEALHLVLDARKAYPHLKCAYAEQRFATSKVQAQVLNDVHCQADS